MFPIHMVPQASARATHILIKFITHYVGTTN